MYDSPARWTPIEVKGKDKCNPGSLRNLTLNSYLSNIFLVGGQRSVIQNNGNIFKFDLLTNKWSMCACVDGEGHPLNVALDSHSTIVYSRINLI